MRRGLALGATLPLLAMTLASACGNEAKDEPRYLDEASFEPETGTDARPDRYVPCDPSLSTCSGDAASDAPPDGSDGGACPAANDCTAARSIGTLIGDTNAEQLSASGSKSEWLSVRITESLTGLSIGHAMKALISLVSPPGGNFDLLVYYDPLTDLINCTPPAAASSTQQAGISDAVSLVWGEGSVPNASDDSRTVIVEVRHVSGNCSPTAQWTLLVQGNQ